MAGKKQKAKSGLKWLGRGAYGGLILSGVRFISPDIAGKYQSALDKALAGGIMHLTKRGPGIAFLTVATSEVIANLLDDFAFPLLGRVTGLGIGTSVASGRPQLPVVNSAAYTA